MKSKNVSQIVSVSVMSFDRIFIEAKYPLAIDTYQRGFVWGDEKIDQLIDDLQDYSNVCRNNNGQALNYYMGTVLLHESQDQKRLYVIDGQQRLTVLSILHQVLMKSIPVNNTFRYRCMESAGNIKRAQDKFQVWDLKNSCIDLFKKICFTVITVKSEDLAFTFFDTQNNRGIPPNATDLLKSFHLRAIQGQESEDLQTYCAKRWEGMQGFRHSLWEGVDFAPILFRQFLWRARCWTGQRNLERESHDRILWEFQKQTVPPESDGDVPLYPSLNNRFAASLTLLPQGKCQLNPQRQPGIAPPEQLPFILRQPINQGIGFFLYTWKYTSMVDCLMDRNNSDPEIKEFGKFYDQVVASLSIYLRELFLLSCVMYLDKFGTNKLFHFALLLDHVLGAIRFKKEYIFKEAPLVYLRDSSKNLLDVISGAYSYKQVIDHLKFHKDADLIYDSDDSRNIEVGKGVRGHYKQRLMAYYGKKNLKDKARWISDSFVEEKFL